ncbi:MAG: TIGR03435 family protein [Vicinamibacterales bacterium]
MKDRELEEALDRGFTRHGEPSPEQVASDLARIRERLEVRAFPVASALRVASAFRRKAATRWLQLAAAAVLVLAATVGTAIVWRAADDPLFRVVEGNVYQGETIRSNGGGGAVLALADGSRIEMRSHTELSLDRADDGVRIRLSNGGIVVNAARQRSGHLYVQTKDMMVSVVGTVFVVNADADGSRVAVIEGEVRVQQGATETKLRPGEGAATSPQLETVSVASELAWSRRAADLRALLQRQSAVQQEPVTAAPQPPKEPRVAFEVVSIRSAATAPQPAPGARGGGQGLNSRPAPSGCVFDSFGYSLQLDPRRLAVNRTTLLHLAAYTIPAVRQEIGKRQDVNCDSLTKVGLLSGGPDWIRRDVWDVVAGIPEGVFTRTPTLTDPILQQMLRTMLSERFGLVMRRETREVPVYLLKVGKDGPKFNGVKPIDPNRGPVLFTIDAEGKRVRVTPDLPPLPDGTINIIGGFAFSARSLSMADWANHLFGIDGRPVLDRTALTGRYDFYYDDPAGRSRTLTIPEPGALDRAVLKAMGFELEESRAPYDVWLIERAEKATEN